MTQPLDLTKPVQTRDGRKVEILRTDIFGPYSILGIFAGNTGMHYGLWDKGGVQRDCPTPLDLVNAPDSTEALRYALNDFEGRIKVREELSERNTDEHDRAFLIGHRAAAEALSAEIERLTPKVPIKKVRYGNIYRDHCMGSDTFNSPVEAKAHAHGMAGDSGWVAIATVTWEEESP